MNTSALSDWMIERSFKSLVQLRNSSERERIINYLAFFVSTLLNYGCCRVLDAIFEIYFLLYGCIWIYLVLKSFNKWLTSEIKYSSDFDLKDMFMHKFVRAYLFRSIPKIIGLYPSLAPTCGTGFAHWGDF